MKWQAEYTLKDGDVEAYVKRRGKRWGAYMFDGSGVESFGTFPTRKAAMKRVEEALALYRRLFPKTGS